MLVVLANAHLARRTSRQAMAERNPVPPAMKDDAEDVSWALSTAEAMWTRGDKDEALKWIRRAVESASEAGADDRALQLAKAAADLASYVGPAPTAPATPAAAPVTPVKAAAPTPSAPRVPNAVAVTPRAPAAVRSPSPPVRPAAGSPPMKPAPTRAPRKSSSNLANETKGAAKIRPALPPVVPDNEVTQEVRVPPAWEAPRRAPAEIVATPAAPPATDEIDAWPTQSLAATDLDNEQDELTRIGEPAYVAGTETLAAVAPAKPAKDDLHPSQAVRVVVWRSADGVHVAPHGTTVNAIVVEAMLVALDPAADLAAWLAKR
jgi:hypothetical protein